MATLAEADTIQVRAHHLGERIDLRGLERRESLGTAPLALRTDDGGVAVLFRYGVVVLFNTSTAAEQTLLESLGAALVEALPRRETDEARLRIDAASDEQVDPNGIVVIKEASIGRLQVIADILAKSMVLAHYEGRIAGVFDRVEPLATTLRTRGRVGARGRDLLRQIGDVLAMQHKMVGRVETGEKPELLWEHPELGRFYDRLADEYELRERDRALDRKLDVISRTVETLLGLVQSRSSLRVEWYIAALIIAELLLSFFPLPIAR